MIWRFLCLLLLQVVRTHVFVMLCIQHSSLQTSSYTLLPDSERRMSHIFTLGSEARHAFSTCIERLPASWRKKRTIVSLTVNWKLFFNTKLKNLWCNWQKDSSINSNGFYYKKWLLLQKRLYFIISFSMKLQLYFKMQRNTKNISTARTVFAWFLKK